MNHIEKVEIIFLALLVHGSSVYAATDVALSTTPTTTPTTTTTVYSASYKGHNYQLFKTKMNFAQAVVFCSSQDSYLVSISSQDELQWIQSFLINKTDVNYDSVWVIIFN